MLSQRMFLTYGRRYISLSFLLRPQSRQIWSPFRNLPKEPLTKTKRISVGFKFEDTPLGRYKVNMGLLNSWLGRLKRNVENQLQTKEEELNYLTSIKRGQQDKLKILVDLKFNTKGLDQPLQNMREFESNTMDDSDSLENSGGSRGGVMERLSKFWKKGEQSLNIKAKTNPNENKNEDGNDDNESEPEETTHKVLAKAVKKNLEDKHLKEMMNLIDLELAKSWQPEIDLEIKQHSISTAKERSEFDNESEMKWFEEIFKHANVHTETSSLKMDKEAATIQPVEEIQTTAKQNKNSQDLDFTMSNERATEIEKKGIWERKKE